MKNGRLKDQRAHNLTHSAMRSSKCIQMMNDLTKDFFESIGCATDFIVEIQKKNYRRNNGVFFWIYFVIQLKLKKKNKPENDNAPKNIPFSKLSRKTCIFTDRKSSLATFHPTHKQKNHFLWSRKKKQIFSTNINILSRKLKFMAEF